MTDHSILQVRGISDRPRAGRGSPPCRAVKARAHGVKPLMRISLLDGIALRVGGREIALSSRKAKALIAYLVLTPGMKETRDRLVGLLWSETEDAKARSSLRQLLHGLREAFDGEGVPGLSTDKVHVSLDEAIIATDLDQALASVDQGDPADVLVNETRITDAFLRGYDDIDPSFGNWLTMKRESVRQVLIRRLEAQLSDASHQTEATKRLARALFQVDPTHEIACQQLMRTCVASGNVAGALASYKQLWECLEEEYDIEPSTATQELVVAIKSGTYWPAVTDHDLSHPKNGAASAEEVTAILLAVRLAVAKLRASSFTKAAELVESGVAEMLGHYASSQTHWRGARPGDAFDQRLSMAAELSANVGFLP